MRSLAFSFLFLYVALVELYVGTLAIACFRVMVDARWLDPLMPAVNRVQKAGWALALLFPLLVLASPTLFPWHSGEHTAFREAYLSLPGFAMRGVLYWAIWLSVSRGALSRRPWAGAPGIVLIVLSGTFASIDWLLSLDAHFGSTIFGFVFLLSAFLLSIGFAIFFGSARANPGERQDQGSVHLAILCTWTYVAFMQFLVVWSGNLPDEAAWYLRRSQGGWALIPAMVALLQFFGPFFLLLQSPIKRSLRASRALALLSVSMQLLLLFWHIAPALRATLSLSITDVAAFILFAAAFAWCGKERRA